MERQPIGDQRTARRFLGYFRHGDHKELIQLEYRYARHEGYSEWLLHTLIQGRQYLISSYKFFEALSELLGQLPLGSVIVLPHQIIISRGNLQELGTLEEWLYPPGDREVTETVVYQLRLLVGSQCIETSRYTEYGYQVSDLGLALEQLHSRLPCDVCLRICYFCEFLVEYNDFGGTDYRHDQLYCYRDNPDVLEEVRKAYPVLRDCAALLLQGTPDMDALHSCSAFMYRDRPRPQTPS